MVIVLNAPYRIIIDVSKWSGFAPVLFENQKRYILHRVLFFSPLHIPFQHHNFFFFRLLFFVQMRFIFRILRVILCVSHSFLTDFSCSRTYSRGIDSPLRPMTTTIIIIIIIITFCLSLCSLMLINRVKYEKQKRRQHAMKNTQFAHHKRSERVNARKVTIKIGSKLKWTHEKWSPAHRKHSTYTHTERDAHTVHLKICAGPKTIWECEYGKIGMGEWGKNKRTVLCQYK